MQSSTKIDVWIAALLTGVAGLIFYPFASIGVDPHHDGIMLKPAMDVLSGQVLQRDTFSQYGPLTTYLQALALAFSPTLLSLRLLTVAAYAGSLGLLYLAWRGLLPRVLALTAVLLFLVSVPFFIPYIVMIPWSSTLALFFQSLALLALMRLVAGSFPGVWAWVLGFACACTLWCRQPVGIILTASVAVIAVGLHLTGWRHPHSSTTRMWGRFAAGFAAVTVLMLGYLAANGALFAWWEQTIVWPRRWAAVAGTSHFPSIFKFWFLQIGVLIFVGVLGLALAPSLIRRFRVKFPLSVDLVWWGLLVLFYWVFGRDWVRTSLLIEQGGWRPLILVLIVLLSLAVVFSVIVPSKGGRPDWYYLLSSLSGISLGSAAQIFPMPCVNHVFWALAPGFGLIVWLICKCLNLSPSKCALFILALLTPAAYDKYNWARLNLSLPRHELSGVLVGLHGEADIAAAITRVQRSVGMILERNSNQAVILYGDDAVYLTFFNNRENPSPYYVTWRELLTIGDTTKRMNYVAKHKPVILMNGPNVAQLNVVPDDYGLFISESLLDLKIMVPRHVLEELTAAAKIER